MRRWLPLLAVILSAPGPRKTDNRPDAQDPFHLILNDPTERDRPEKHCKSEVCSSLLELIEGAQKSVDFAIYGMRGQPEIFKALEAAKARGVVVRGYVDRTLDGKNYYADTDALVKALGTVKDDVEVDKRKAPSIKPYDPKTSTCWWPAPQGFEGPKQCVGYDLGDRCVIAVHASREPLTFAGDIMHHKYFVVDGEYIWTGSTNVSDSGTGGYNANVVGVVYSPRVASWYQSEFEQLWSGRAHDEKSSQGQLSAQLTPDVSVDTYFSPQDRPITRAVRPLLQKARHRIDVAIFFLTHKGIAKDLIEAHQRGVKVRVIMDATAAKNGYAKHELVRQAGIPVKIEDWGGKMHMKSVAVDGEYVVLGSMNWTSAGERGNDENTMVFRSTRHAEQFHRFYDMLWNDIDDKWLTGRPDPESRDSSTACTDGSDNDFDRLRDDEDPGCGDNPPEMPAMPPFVVVPKMDGQKLIKGNISSNGRRIYHVPGGEYYDRVDIRPLEGEAFFCSEEDARAAGFTRSSR